MSTRLVQKMQKLLEHGSLEELTAFVAVGEAGSFAGAANLLGRDASVISRRVSQLERRLSVRLLSRTTRHVSLTEVGSVYFRRLQAILDELATASTEASDFAAYTSRDLEDIASGDFRPAMGRSVVRLFFGAVSANQDRRPIHGSNCGRDR